MTYRVHMQEISSTLGCPEDTTGLVNCLKNEKSFAEIVTAHKKYYVSPSQRLYRPTKYTM